MQGEVYTDMVARYTQTLLDFDYRNYNDEKGMYHVPDEITYLAAYIGKFVDEPTFALLDKINDVNVAMQNYVIPYILVRRIAMCQSIDSRADYLEEIGKYKMRIGALNCLGNIYSTMNQQTEALAARNRQVETVKRYWNEGKLYDVNALVTAYMNRAVTYKSLKDYGKCIDIRERLHEAGKLYDENDLASVYMNRGNTLQSTGQYKESLKDYGKCIAIMESLHEEGKLYDENDLASAYMNRGVMYYDLGQYEESLRDYGKCIDIRETLYEAGKLYEIGDMATAMLNKGILLADGLHDTQGVLELFNHAIALLEAEQKLSYSANDTLERLRSGRDMFTSQSTSSPKKKGFFGKLFGGKK